jgi:oligopeptide/dipeptide ABC transporter ATP-binding protein
MDVVIQDQVMEQFVRVQQESESSILMISHDLSLIRYTCDRVAIMYLRKIMELGPTERVLKNPGHPYSRALILTEPIPNPLTHRKRVRLTGEPTLAHEMIPGCRFQPRCPERLKRCETDPPTWRNLNPGTRNRKK